VVVMMRIQQLLLRSETTRTRTRWKRQHLMGCTRSCASTVLKLRQTRSARVTWVTSLDHANHGRPEANTLLSAKRARRLATAYFDNSGR
jgi:hypothetical protein